MRLFVRPAQGGAPAIPGCWSTSVARADEAGLDGVVISDHVLMGNRTDRYQ